SLCPFFLSPDTSPTCLSTLSLHDALPIWKVVRPLRDLRRRLVLRRVGEPEPLLGAEERRRLVPQRHRLPERQLHVPVRHGRGLRSEEHTSELQSRSDLVCRLLLEKKN